MKDDFANYTVDDSPMFRLAGSVLNTLLIPARFVRHQIVEPLSANLPKYPYYHRRFERVPTIDQCLVNDRVCEYEAQSQYIRDKKVDSAIVKILGNRNRECRRTEVHPEIMCTKALKDFEEAKINFFIKYGDLRENAGVIHCYMKQKHRMVNERRQREKQEAAVQEED